MAIDIKTTSQLVVSDISSGTSLPSLNTDIGKVSPAIQAEQVTSKEMSDLKRTQPIKLDAAELESAVSKLNDLVEQQKRNIRFSIDKDTDRTVIQLLDSNGDVLKQIPSEEVLAILKGIESNKGLFLKYDV